MASSVSSERAFLSAGITISKHCNWLKGDIVEALQCMKCIYHNDLLFWEVLVLSKIESELDGEDIIDVDMDSGEVLEEADEFSWDKVVADDGDNNENLE